MQQRNPRSAAADGHSKTYQDIICHNLSSRSTGCFKHQPAVSAGFIRISCMEPAVWENLLSTD